MLHNTQKVPYLPPYTDPRKAFEKAVADGRLSDNMGASNYAGDFMYMGDNEAGKAMFKNIITREYLA